MKFFSSSSFLRRTLVFMSLVFFVGISPAFANDGKEGKGGDEKNDTPEKFLERKTKFLANLEQEITVLQTAKNCATAATVKEEMKKCRKELQGGRKKIREERQSMMKNRKG